MKRTECSFGGITSKIISMGKKLTDQKMTCSYIWHVFISVAFNLLSNSMYSACTNIEPLKQLLEKKNQNENHKKKETKQKTCK